MRALPSARSVGAVVAVALVIGATPSLATPLFESHVGGTVFVGPTSIHPSSLFWNPAAPGQATGNHFAVVGSARLDQISVERLTIRSSDGEPDAAGDRSFPSASDTPITPGGFAGGYTSLGDQLTLGAAFYLPFAEELPDAVPLAYHARGGSFFAEYSTISVSFRASNTLFFGFGTSLVFPQARLEYLRDPALDDCGTPPCDVEDPARAEAWTVQTDSMFTRMLAFRPAISINAGVLVNVAGWWIGAAYHTPPTVRIQQLDIPNDATIHVTTPTAQVDAPGRLTFRLPAIFTLGARRALTQRYDLVVNFHWIDLSLHDLYDIRGAGRALDAAGLPEWQVRYRGLSDVYSLAVGVESGPMERLRLGGSVGIESSAVTPAAVAPGQIDAPKLDVAGGAQLHLTDHLSISVGYSLALFMPEQNGTAPPSVYSPSSAISCVGSGYDLEACDASRDGRALPTAAGSYSRISHELVVGLQWDDFGD